MSKIVGVIVTLAALSALGGILNKRADTTPSQAEYVAAVQETAARMLKNPSSARFHGVRFSERYGKRIVCGGISGTNSFGAYVDEARFVSVDGLVHVLSNLNPTAAARSAWDDYC
jgi:hypothetical protein